MGVSRFLTIAILLATAFPSLARDDGTARAWLAGDHHVHSEWSVDWDRSTNPPTPIRGGDSPYTRTRNAQQALANGLRWMVHTDHGGPGHSRVTLQHAWPALEQARRDVAGLIQFNGMEFDVPGGEHASLIVPPGAGERDRLGTIERDYSRREPLQAGTREDGRVMLDALAHMRALAPQPLVFINHPSRSATGVGTWGDVTPDELRTWHDAAPQVLVGMEGAPGHQAAPTHRGLYRNNDAPTFGGFDQMTAQVGGVWDAMLASGRRFWITATSDSHENVRDGGRDFDPGQYSKTYVWARPEADDILDGLRRGRMFAVTGDLIDALELTVTPADNAQRGATMGGTLKVRRGTALRVALKLRQPQAPNANGDRPVLDHVDLIVGSAGPDGAPRMEVKRLDASAWTRDGQWLSMQWEVPALHRDGFVRVRGSNTGESAPGADAAGEDPWTDLWFYSNPVFVQLDTSD
ncbi:hypothetical protein [Lysobacter arvi]|uniref:Phosphoesterase n=1 Tax=Lysobacter arvi TaxID=3038776 RepID=A0ABU1CA76_9GAMM|nr:hypothetical protein [Lysobacter arvi]MDR0182088.1 hypothetical protein [Lysobacter arvi]